MLNKPVPENSKCVIFGLIAVIVTGATLLPMDYNPVVRASNTQENSREHSEANTIVPGVRVGEYKLGMSKDDVLKKLGKGAAHIVYRSDKWSAERKKSDYEHPFGKGVQIFCGPSVRDPEVFICFGGKLTLTERGLVW